MKAQQLPSLEYLSECFEISEDSPSGLVWKVRPLSHFSRISVRNVVNAKYAGKVAGHIKNLPCGKDYYVVGVDRKYYFVHRVVLSMFRKSLISTDAEVDHIDGDGLNNRPTNLRESSRSNNSMNIYSYTTNTSGSKGVFLNVKRNVWYGQVTLNGKRHCTGYSPSKEIIIELVRELREKLHKDFCNHGI